MGRFASTVPYYSRYREPYPPAFFETVAKGLNFTGHERLADIGCGPAPLAIGFAGYVGSCTGIDPESEMLAEAREQATGLGISLDLIQARIEQLGTTVGAFDVVTIGRALHWMEPRATLAVLDHMVSRGGSILICSASPPRGPGNPWLEPYNEVRNRWVDHRDEERYSADAQARFAGSRFRYLETIAVTISHSVTIDELVKRSLSRSTTSPHVLGPRMAEFEQELAEALQPFSIGGSLHEELRASAGIFR